MFTKLDAEFHIACHKDTNYYQFFTYTDAPTTWLPIHPNYKEINVEVEDAADESHLKVYKHLVQLRQDERVKSGDVKTMSVESVFAFSRSGFLNSHD